MNPKQPHGPPMTLGNVPGKAGDPDPERIQIEFFRASIEYYVSGRFAVFAPVGQIAGNLLHHAIEMALKGALAKKQKTLADLKRYLHDLPSLWAYFKALHPGNDLDKFDDVIGRLHEFEDLRYPDAVLLRGMMLRIDPGKRPPGGAATHSGPEPTYELYLGDVDELMDRVFDVASINPVFFTGPIQRSAREYLLRDNSSVLLTKGPVLKEVHVKNRFLLLWLIGTVLWIVSVLAFYSDELLTALEYRTVYGLVPVDCGIAPPGAARAGKWCWITIQTGRELARNDAKNNNGHLSLWSPYWEFWAGSDEEIVAETFRKTGAPRALKLGALVRVLGYIAAVPPILILGLGTLFAWIDRKVLMSPVERLFFRLGAVATASWALVVLALGFLVAQVVQPEGLVGLQLFGSVFYYVPALFIFASPPSTVSAMIVPPLVMFAGGIAIAWAFRGLR
jgi:hypothetical protein